MIVGDMEIRLRVDLARLQRDMDDARRVVGDATAAMGRAAGTAMAAPLTAPRTAFNGSISGRRAIALADMSLEELLEV